MLGFRSEAERRWRVSRSIQAWISAATRERECVERGAREEGSEALRVVEGVDEGFEAVEVVGESGEVGVGGGEDGVELEECLYGWGIRGVVSLYVVGGFFQSFKDSHQLWGFFTLFFFHLSVSFENISTYVIFFKTSIQCFSLKIQIFAEFSLPNCQLL